MTQHNYEKLIVWQKAMDLVEEVYRLTERFPKTELYGLTSQMRRAAVSIPSNIAEGSRRKTQKDFCHFLTMAFSSGAELETQILISKRLRFISTDTSKECDTILSEVMRILNRLIYTSIHS